MPRVTAQRDRPGSRSGYGHIARRLAEHRMAERALAIATVLTETAKKSGS
jgi:hypothetical protein